VSTLMKRFRRLIKGGAASPPLKRKETKAVATDACVAITEVGAMGSNATTKKARVFFFRFTKRHPFLTGAVCSSPKLSICEHVWKPSLRFRQAGVHRSTPSLVHSTLRNGAQLDSHICAWTACVRLCVCVATGRPCMRAVFPTDGAYSTGENPML
jgi:hypothetical protein